MSVKQNILISVKQSRALGLVVFWLCLQMLLTSSLWSDDSQSKMINFSKVQQQIVKTGSASSFAEIYAEYIGKRVMARGFLIQTEYGYVLSQTPLIRSCCNHVPSSTDLVQIAWHTTVASRVRDTNQQKIVVVVGDFKIEDNRPWLVNAQIVPIKSPLESVVDYLRQMFGFKD